jgi:hypothetical protein
MKVVQPPGAFPYLCDSANAIGQVAHGVEKGPVELLGEQDIKDPAILEEYGQPIDNRPVPELFPTFKVLTKDILWHAPSSDARYLHD